MTNNILTARLARLAGCAGQWILDLRDSDQRGYDLHHLASKAPLGSRGYSSNPAEALAFCCENHWRDCRLLFSPDKLNDDTSWPGGYDAPSIYRSNARVFRDEFKRELEDADGDSDGIALDLRYVTDEIIEAIEGLENYPLLDEDDHSSLELELQDEAWKSWAERDWRGHVEKALQEYAPEDADAYWADEILDRVPDCADKLRKLFHACAESSNTYWCEESDGCQWIDLERIAGALDRADLVDLTGLPLLPPDQEWRREPYPWPGDDPAPLVPPLPVL